MYQRGQLLQFQHRYQYLKYNGKAYIIEKNALAVVMVSNRKETLLSVMPMDEQPLVELPEGPIYSQIGTNVPPDTLNIRHCVPLTNLELETYTQPRKKCDIPTKNLRSLSKTAKISVTDML